MEVKEFFSEGNLPLYLTRIGLNPYTFSSFIATNRIKLLSSIILLIV